MAGTPCRRLLGKNALAVQKYGTEQDRLNVSLLIERADRAEAMLHEMADLKYVEVILRMSSYGDWDA